MEFTEPGEVHNIEVDEKTSADTLPQKGPNLDFGNTEI